MTKTNAFILFATTMFLTLWNIGVSYSQDFTEELMVRLPKPYQYKLLKAETFNKKGVSFLEKAGSAPDSALLADTTLSEKEEEQIDNYYINRIKAAYCFRDANGLVYGVADKFIKEFWKKFKGDKKPLEILIRIENAAYDSLIRADGLREKAEQQSFLIDKVPLVTTAEVIEGKALFRLEKVLYAYMNWPEQLNVAWLFSEDKTDPRLVKADSAVMLSSIQLDMDTTKKEFVSKASSIYSLMHISDNQIDKFNEFLKTQYPTKAERYLIDFQKLNQNVIDSLHRKWQEYSFGGKLGTDTVQSKVFPNIATPQTANKPADIAEKNIVKHGNQIPDQQAESVTNNKSPDEKGFLYKVQIAASRRKMKAQEIKGIYSGADLITESYEDNWYKYTIGKFGLYNEAKSYKNTVKVKGAFVIAYFNGKRIKITTEMTNVNR